MSNTVCSCLFMNFLNNNNSQDAMEWYTPITEEKSYLNWHNSRNDWDGDTNVSTILQELKECLVLKEKLRNNEICSRIHFLLQMLKIFLITGTVWMTIRVACMNNSYRVLAGYFNLLDKCVDNLHSRVPLVSDKDSLDGKHVMAMCSSRKYPHSNPPHKRLEFRWRERASWGFCKTKKLKEVL